MAQRFANGVGEIEAKLSVVGDALSRNFDDHSASVVQRIEALGLQLSQTIGGENDRLATRLADVSGRLEQTLTTQGGALDATLAKSAERLAARVREHVEGARTVFESAEGQLAALLSAAHRVARDDFQARGQALHENLTRDLSQTAAQLGEHASAVQERFAAVAGDAVSAIGVQGDRVSETLAERIRAFEQIGADPGRRNRRAGDRPRRPCAIGAVRTDRRLRKRLSRSARRRREPRRRAWRPRGGALAEGSRPSSNRSRAATNETAHRVAEQGDRVAGTLTERLAAFENVVTERAADAARRSASMATARPAR